MASSFRDIIASTAREFVKQIDLSRFVSVVHIDGVEVTQAMQYYGAEQHLTDAADRGADNSITLVMYKPAWVRVYVGTLFGDRDVTGQLVVERRLRWIPATAAPLTLDPIAPGTAVATANADYAAQRSTTGATLNFLIPADAMAGQLTLTVKIWPVGGGDAEHPAVTREVHLGVHLQQTLAVRGILISYDGPNLAGNANISLAAPSVGELTATTAWCLTTMPVQSEPSVSSAGTLAWTTPLTGVATQPGGCSQQWLDLNTAIAEVKANDGNRTDVIYYGLLPATIPIANVGGCASAGVTSGSNGDGVTMAHEVGHFCGLPHAPCGTPGDPNYPAYEPYDPANTPTASLGEYGLDINTGQVRLPAEKDVMSYCSGSWFSLYNYQRLIANPALRPIWATFARRIPELVDPYVFPWEELMPPHPEWEHQFEKVRAQPLVSVIGILAGEDRVDVRSVMRVNATPAMRDATATPYNVQLLDATGRVISEAPLMRLPAQGGCKCGGCGGEGDKEPPRPPYTVQAMMPDVAPGSEMRIVRAPEAGPSGDKMREAKTIWSRKAPKSAPRLGDVRVEIKKDGSGAVRWSAERSETPLRFSIQFSKDGGKSWNSVAAGLSGDSFRFDATPLPSGELLFRVLAHDGFHSAAATAKAVTLPSRPPIPAILHPRPRGLFAAGEPMRLWGTTVARGASPRGAGRFRWLVDGKEAGTGSDLWIPAPSAGRHSCELVVEDEGGPARTSIEFETVGGEAKGGTGRPKPR